MKKNLHNKNNCKECEYIRRCDFANRDLFLGVDDCFHNEKVKEELSEAIREGINRSKHDSETTISEMWFAFLGTLIVFFIGAFLYYMLILRNG